MEFKFQGVIAQNRGEEESGRGEGLESRQSEATIKVDFYEANCAANSPRKFSRRICFLISTQMRILGPLSLLISYIMTPNVNTLLLLRKRIIILNLMLLHRKKQKSKKSAWVRKIFKDGTKKGEFHLLVRDLRLRDHQYQFFLHSTWFQASCEAFRREKVELVSIFSNARFESILLKLHMLSSVSPRIRCTIRLVEVHLNR